MKEIYYIIIIAILVIGIVLLLSILVQNKPKIQVVDNFIVYNSKGVFPDKIKKGDTIIGKFEGLFIIADVESLEEDFKKGLGYYLTNRKIK